MARYWGTTAAGLEEVVIKEVEAVCGQVGGDSAIQAPQILHGGVIFNTHASPKVVASLRSLDAVYAYVAHFKNVPHSKEEAGPYFKDLATKIDWAPALRLHQAWQEKATQPLPPSQPSQGENDKNNKGGGGPKRVLWKFPGDVRSCVREVTETRIPIPPCGCFVG